MNRCAINAAVVVVGWVVLHSARAGTPLQLEQRIACPPEIPAESLPLAKAPPGWTPSTRGRLILHAVDLSYGPPAEQAFLKPEVANKQGKNSTYKWTELEVGGNVAGIWVACNYGRSDNVILGKRLDDNVGECFAADTQDNQGRVMIEVRCKLKK